MFVSVIKYGMLKQFPALTQHLHQFMDHRNRVIVRNNGIKASKVNDVELLNQVAGRF